MKLLLLLSFLTFSTTLFAQDNYHVDPQEVCESQDHCLVDQNSDWIIKMVSWENDMGEIDGSKLTSNSFLADTVYKGAKLCYKGDAKAVCDLLEVMSNVDGGDAIIRKFSCQIKDQKVAVEYSVEYYGYGIESFGSEIKKCL